MREYESKKALIAEIEKTAALFINEFSEVKEADKDKLIGDVDRTPAQMIAYQLGWLNLIMGWDRDEEEGKPVITPCEGYKWKNPGALYRSFFDKYSSYSLAQCRNYLRKRFPFLLNGLTDLRKKRFSRRAAVNGLLPHHQTGRCGNGYISIPSLLLNPSAAK